LENGEKKMGPNKKMGPVPIFMHFFVIASPERMKQSPKICHCEERSDAAISTFFYEIVSFHSPQRIATLPLVARDDL
jgi:hypothetical protein